MDAFTDPLPFTLVDMTEEELLNEMYVDIPSDIESVVSQNSDIEEEPRDIEETLLLEECESESEQTLAEWLRNNPDYSSVQLPEPGTCQDKPYSVNWDQFQTVDRPKPFVEESGVPDFIRNMEEPTPGKLFQLFITNDLLNHIVFETNLYAQQVQQDNGKTYIPTNKTEIMAFLGINILMGIKSSPSYRDYWSSAPDLHDHYISELMNVNRFSWLLGNLHLNDNNMMPRKGSPGFDKLYKVRPFIDALEASFEKCFLLSESFAIDESMIRFKGRSTIKQYLPKKPIKWGYKVWSLADKSGYLKKFQIYTGKEGPREKLLGPRVVKDLCKGLENKNHRLYFDNYFSTVKLLAELKERGIYACSTINKNRKNFPTFKADKRMKRGEYDYFINNEGVSMVKWKDNKAVHLISNFHDPTMATTVRRKGKDGSVQDVACPVMLTDYNKNMNSVDKFDQKKQCYEINRKSKKWWHRIFFHFIDACVVNSFIIYTNLNLPNLTMKDFRRQIVNYLVCETLTAAKKRKRTDSPVLLQNRKPMVPLQIRQSQSAHLPKSTSRRRCGRCSTKNCQIRTEWMCTICKVPLCLSKSRNCFLEYHL